MLTYLRLCKSSLSPTTMTQVSSILRPLFHNLLAASVVVGHFPCGGMRSLSPYICRYCIALGTGGLIHSDMRTCISRPKSHARFYQAAIIVSYIFLPYGLILIPLINARGQLRDLA